MSTAKPLQWHDWNRTHPIAFRLDALYAIDELHGPTIFDKVQGKDGSLIDGPTRVGQDLSFDGNNDYADFGSPFSPGTGNMCVVIIHDVRDVDAFSIANRVTSVSDGYEILIGAGGVPGLAQLRFQDNIDRINVGQTSGLNDGKLHHFAMNFTPSNGEFYVDGVFRGSAARTGALDSSQDLYIARHGSVFGAVTVSLVAIWNRFLLAEEISELHANPYLLTHPPVTSVSMYFQAPVTGIQVGILHRGQLPGILARAG